MKKAVCELLEEKPYFGPTLHKVDVVVEAGVLLLDKKYPDKNLGRRFLRDVLVYYIEAFDDAEKKDLLRDLLRDGETKAWELGLKDKPDRPTKLGEELSRLEMELRRREDMLPGPPSIPRYPVYF